MVFKVSQNNHRMQVGIIKKQKLAVYISGLLAVLAVFLVIGWAVTVQAQSDESNTTADPDISGLNQEIDQKRQELDELKKKANLYEDNVKGLQQQANTLENQLSIINIQVEKTQNDIDTITKEIETTNLELEQLAIEIETKTAEVDKHSEALSQFLRLISRYDERSYLEIIISNTSFSDFFDSFQYAHNLQARVEQTLKTTKEVKSQLEQQESEKSAKKDELGQLSQKLSQTVVNLGDQKEYKTTLLSETQENEETYQQLLEQAKQEQRAAESEVAGLEAKVRLGLKDEGVDFNADTQVIWPIAPLRGISAYFYDPSYPYRKYFEHAAIDIPSPQGTLVRAATSGTVGRSSGCYGGSLGYCIVTVVYNNEFATRYGHLSRVDVLDGTYVVQGQVIGAVGGLPGTPGAGGFTTGPHLHFEVRVGAFPVNPLDYLPGY